MLRIIYLSFILMLWVNSVRAQEHQLVRRIVVFPLKTAEPLSKEAEDSWWKVRELLTESKRFVLASKHFLQKKDVFQARGTLSPSDSIILGKLLDAHILVTCFLDDHQLHMQVYSGEDGSLIWGQEIQLHQSVQIRSQLQKGAESLVKDFIAAIPYQGYQITDPLIGQAVYDDNGLKKAKVEVGVNHQVQEGDPIQWIRLKRKNLGALFNEGGQIEVIAEGKITKIENSTLTAQILRIKDFSLIQDGGLVRLPKELGRIRQEMAIDDVMKRRIELEFISSNLDPASKKAHESKPLVTSLAWLSSIATFLLLAF